MRRVSRLGIWLALLVAATSCALPPTGIIALADAAVVPSGGEVTIPVLANDRPPPGETLRVTATQGGRGVVTIDPAGRLVYRAPEDFSGEDRFSYSVNSDSFPEAEATVVVTVDPALADGLPEDTTTTSVGGTTTTTTTETANSPPVAVEDAYRLDEGSALELNVTLNDFDPDEGDVVRIGNVTHPAHGTLTVNGTSIFYQHDGSETTADSFTYELTDGMVESNAGSVTLSVNPVNDAPVAVDDNANVEEGSSVVIDVLENDLDVDSPRTDLAVIIIDPPENGVVEFTPGAPTYFHDGSETTSDRFTYVVSDGIAESAVATVLVYIELVNFFAPVAIDQTVSTGCDPVTIVLQGSDRDADPLTFVEISDPEHGQIDVLWWLSPTSISVLYTPDRPATEGPYPDDSFAFTVSDGFESDTGLVSIEIDCVAIF